MSTENYYAFLSHGAYLSDCPFDDMTIKAISKQNAREILAKHFNEIGAKTELSTLSEEVIITLQNGRELVYYGFDPE